MANTRTCNARNAIHCRNTSQNHAHNSDQSVTVLRRSDNASQSTGPCRCTSFMASCRSDAFKSCRFISFNITSESSSFLRYNTAVPYAPNTERYRINVIRCYCYKGACSCAAMRMRRVDTQDTVITFSNCSDLFKAS